MLKTMWKSLNNYARHYASDQGAVAAVVFALTIPLIVGSAGMAVDLAQAYNAKNRLSNALDKAVLAAASTRGTDTEIRARLEDFFAVNYPTERFGTPYGIELIIEDEQMTASAYARVPTSFMALLGRDHIDVYEETKVKRELSGVEAVLVLDITGSMAGNNIAALRTASTNFLNIMFDRISDPQYLKIGIVPWNMAVNVGPYGLGRDPMGGTYGTAFVNRPTTDPYVSPASNINYGTGATEWLGCVVERSGSAQMNDAATPNWTMYRYPRSCTRTVNGSCVQWTNAPNTNCANAPIIPLTSNQATLQNSINTLPTIGNTYSNVGMVWGWRVISPTAPFTEGAPYDDPRWSKTVILMTDGDNTINGTYSGEGVAGAAGVSTTVTQQNNKLATVCGNMKALGIRIYTVTFQSAINNTTRNFYRNCASSPSMYYNAPTNAQLVTAFEDIADQLSQLHITE